MTSRWTDMFDGNCSPPRVQALTHSADAGAGSREASFLPIASAGQGSFSLGEESALPLSMVVRCPAANQAPQVLDWAEPRPAALRTRRVE